MTLTAILKPIRSDLLLVERELTRQAKRIHGESAGSRDELVRQPVDHVFNAAGKRLRPALVLLSSRATGNKADRDALIRVATAVELVHTASLIHDDIIDAALTRREQPTVNEAYGNRTAVLVGDLFYAQFFALLKDLRHIGPQRQFALFDLFCDVTRTMCRGEILEDQVNRAGVRMDLPVYLEVIEKKTASLMSASCEAAAIVTGTPARAREALGAFGRALGLAYQLVDDAIDADASFADGAVALQKAEEYGRLACDHLDVLAPGPAVERLRWMSRYVLDKVGESRAVAAACRRA